MTGESVLHYRILEKIGEGGMGVVYKALDTRLDRPVAIKTLRPVYELKSRRQFVWEARAAAKLNHPNIVVVHDVVSSRDHEFIVMEYVAGLPLSEVLLRGPIPLRQMLQQASEIASALEAAHKAGIVHRDLKPSNILITPDGSIKLVDFGLARLPPQDAQSQTIRRVVTGTCGYMSPEQAQGEPATAQSDVFSFGAVLYEMATGQRAFPGESAAVVLAAVLRDDPAAAFESREIPASLGKIIARCLCKDPKNRFQHMGDVRLALEDVADAPKTGDRARRRWLRVLLSAAVGAALMAAGGMLFNLYREPPVNSMPIPLTSFRGEETNAAWSPDGRQVAFTWDGEKANNPDIYVLQPASGNVSRLTTDPEVDRDPAWSPDGRWIAYTHCSGDPRGCSLRLVSSLGREGRILLSNIARLGRACWTPDGRNLLIAAALEQKQPQVVWAVAVETGSYRQLTWPSTGTPGDLAPVVSPDGKALAFCRKTAWRTAELYLLGLNADLTPAGTPRRLTDLGYVADPAWTPDGRRILFEAHRDGAGIWQVDRGGRHMGPVFGVPITASLPAIAKRPDGSTSLVFTNSVVRLSIWRYATGLAPGARSVELAPSTRSQFNPRYSNDGRKLAFSSTRTGFQEIWVANADGSQPVQLTDLRHQLTEAGHWSPNDDTIAFVSQDRGFRRIYLIRATGGPAIPITNEPNVLNGCGWSRDGQSYFYRATSSGTPEIWKVSREGGPPERVVVNGIDFMEAHPGIFYYLRPRPGGSAVMMRRDAGGDRELALTPPPCDDCLTAEAPGGFYYLADPTGELWCYDDTTGRSKRVMKKPAKPFNQFTVAPDGKWFASAFPESATVDLMIMEKIHY